MRRLRHSALVFATALLGWAALTETGLVNHRAVAGPGATARALLADDGALFLDLAATLARLGAGVALGLLVGLPLGVFVGSRARRHRALEPALDFLRAVPPLLVFPLLLLALGYGDGARVAAIAYATTLVIALNVSSGARRTDPARADALRAMGATRWQILRWVRLYELAPSVLLATRHAVSIGLVVAVVTEMLVGAPRGLGARAVDAQIAYEAAGLYAVIALAGASGFSLGSLLMALERRLVPWEQIPVDGDVREECMMQVKLPAFSRRWVGASVVIAVALTIGVSTQLGAVRSGPVPAPIEGQGRAVDRARDLFPQTKGWFRIVATASFSSGSGGRIVPDYSTLTHERVRWQDASGHTIAAHFAPRFRNATRILGGEDADTWIDVVPESGRDVEAQIQDGLVVYPDAYPDTDVLYKSTPTHTDEYLLLRSRDAPNRWSYRIRTGPRIARLRQAGTAVEAVDARGVPWMRANPPFAVDQSGARVDGSLEIRGDRLIAQIDTSTLEPPILVDPDWRSTGDMAYGRFYFGLNVLPDGRVLATGGCSASVCSGDLTLPACRALVNAAEALDLDTRTWSRVGDGSVRGFFHISASLPDGDVLVAGGCGTPDCSATIGLAEVYDVAAGAFRAVDPLPEPNAGHLSAALPDGRILVAGGCDGTTCSDRSYAFDPATGSWTGLGDLVQARGRASVATLPDGRILVTGGCANIHCESVLYTAELYDPATDTWESVGDLGSARAGHYAATLLDGRVLVGGGCAAQLCPTVLASAELFDPRTRAFLPTGTQRIARVGARAVRLPNGSVLVNQGCQTHTDCDLSNEVWSPDTGEFGPVEDAVTTRAFHETVMHVARDQVVAVGGCQPATCSWWNETWDTATLMAPPDAGVLDPDAGPQPDSGPRPDAGPPPPRDAGVDAGSGASGGDGCACRTARPERAPRALLLVLIAMGLLVGARRGRR